MCNIRQNNSGFTLIEVLIAMTLLVILSGALYGTYFSVMKARENAGARVEERRELSMTLGRLQQELASALYVQGNKKLHFKVEDRDSFGKPTSTLQFTTITPPRLDAAPASDVAVVRYAVQEEEGVLHVMRESQDLYLDVKALRYPVLESVEGFLVECYSGGKWVKTWSVGLDSTQGMNSSLPDKVRVSVTTKGGEAFSIIASPSVKQ